MKKLWAAIAWIATLSAPLAVAGQRPPRIHIADMIQPTPKHSVLENDKRFVWGASMVRTDDGTCHLLYCRWPKPFRAWITDAEIAYATADKPAGPYTFQRVILGKRGPEYWDGVSVYNPQVLRVKDKYYLYYAGNNGNTRLETDARGRAITQRIGVAVADTPAGPWKRMDKPLIDISEQGLDASFACNPAVTPTPKGTFLMVYKCGAGPGRKGKVYHTTAEADAPLGPFVKTGQKVFDCKSARFPAEDPFIWYQQGRYYAVVKDKRGAFTPAGKSLVQFESRDGHHWKLSEPPLASKLRIRWSNGRTEKVDRLERPQIWLEDGRPAMLFLAAKKGDHSYNVHIPLAPACRANQPKQKKSP